MHDLMNWDDDEPRPTNPVSPAVTMSAPPVPLLPKPSNGTSTGVAVTFLDVTNGQWREGSIIRTIQSHEHENAYLGHLPIVTLYLVAYTNDTGTPDYTVIYDKLINVPRKPRA